MRDAALARRSLARLLVLLATLAPVAVALPARAQVESREGIALQNQILQLRQELDQARRGGFASAPALAPPARAGGGGELVGALLDRVSALEDEIRRLRGQAEQNDYRIRQLQGTVEKLQGDLDYRMQQIEGRGGGGGPAPQRQGVVLPAPAAPAGPAPASGPRPPERALADGQAAIARRDYASAEAAAREVLAARNTTRGQDAQILLGDALAGKRDFQNAALAYDDAYRRNRQSARAPEAMLGLAAAFQGFNARRESCQTLDELRAGFPRLSPTLAERVQQARRNAGCR